MAVNSKIEPKAKFEAAKRNGLTLSLHYSLPFDTYKDSSWWTRWGGDGTTGSFTTEQQDYVASFSIFDGSLTLGQLRHCFLDLAPFEIANEHEWRGHKPIEIEKNDGGGGKKVIHTERTVWAIASFDQVAGERVTFGLTHAPKDQLFTVQTRLGMVIDQARQLAAPYEAEIRANYKAKRISPETDDDKAMVEELRKDWEENKPDWNW